MFRLDPVFFIIIIIIIIIATIIFTQHNLQSCNQNSHLKIKKAAVAAKYLEKETFVNYSFLTCKKLHVRKL